MVYDPGETNNITRKTKTFGAELMLYDKVAITKASNFLKELEVLTKLFFRGTILKQESSSTCKTFTVRFPLGDGDESLGWDVRIELDLNGELAANPLVTSWTDRNYLGNL